MTPAEEDARAEFDALTPMQQLVLEVLGARYRLGHELWTFTMNDALPKALKALEAGGYATKMPGIAQGTVRASLTDAGKRLVLDPGYVPPRPLNRR